MSMRRLQFSEGEYYHLYSRGVEKRKIFLDNGDYRRFVTLLYTANSDTPVHLSNYQGRALLDIPKGDAVVALGAWCLMPNHFHLLVRESKEGGISTFIQRLLTGYSMYFNKKYERTGSLFERRFNAKHLNSDNYLKHQYSYIHLNPLGVVDVGWKEKSISNKRAADKFLNQYPYSSYLDYTGTERIEGVLLEKSAFPDYFKTTTEFKELLNNWINSSD